MKFTTPLCYSPEVKHTLFETLIRNPFHSRNVVGAMQKTEGIQYAVDLMIRALTLTCSITVQVG